MWWDDTDYKTFRLSAVSRQMALPHRCQSSDGAAIPLSVVRWRCHTAFRRIKLIHLLSLDRWFTNLFDPSIISRRSVWRLAVSSSWEQRNGSPGRHPSPDRPVTFPRSTSRRPSPVCLPDRLAERHLRWLTFLFDRPTDRPTDRRPTDRPTYDRWTDRPTGDRTTDRFNSWFVCAACKTRRAIIGQYDVSGLSKSVDGSWQATGDAELIKPLRSVPFVVGPTSDTAHNGPTERRTSPYVPPSTSGRLRWAASSRSVATSCPSRGPLLHKSTESSD